jgi:taurine dioxygenase
MYAAWDEMPGALRAEIARLSLKHDATIDAAGYPRHGHDHSLDVTKSAGATHPLVRTHPETGRNCLYLGRRSKSYLPVLDVAQSEALLDRLWSHATQDRYTWHHRWQPGDVLMWDNRAVMHRRNPFDATARRLLHRVVVKGTPPYNSGYDFAPHPRSTLRPQEHVR